MALPLPSTNKDGRQMRRLLFHVSCPPPSPKFLDPLLSPTSQLLMALSTHPLLTTPLLCCMFFFFCSPSLFFFLLLSRRRNWAGWGEVQLKKREKQKHMQKRTRRPAATPSAMYIISSVFKPPSTIMYTIQKYSTTQNSHRSPNVKDRKLQTMVGLPLISML